ncbi:MAG: chemotaxis protein CheB, partial [Marinirhabdus sp.]|nr:chemotaxis protein CheB [Marinirhabdus sp.]
MTIKSENHIVIGVGASAGGLEALTEFFNNVPKTSNMTFVVVQHLSPDHKSLMGELLSKQTELPVVEISQDAPIQRNTIYIIPPTMNLVIENNQLRLLKKPEGKELNLPIDMFFESMAKTYQNNAVGIVLSGTGSDGTRGIWHIKEHGGLVIAQQPSEAKFDGMPQSVINTGLADYILPVDEMYTEIENYFNASRMYDDAEMVVSKNERVFTEILNLLKRTTELDFNLYKKPTLVRRMSRRLQIHQMSNLEDYLTLLRTDPDEIDILYKEFLIGVTKFFRDEPIWETVETEAISEIISNADDGDIVKVWNVGCSTGEETYTIAMLMMEECERQNKQLSIKIFATDISQFHLDIASRGEYNQAVATNIPQGFLVKYFNLVNGTFKVKDYVRRSVIFSNHNIIKDPPFNHIDLVVCRNLLIYFQPKIQNRVLKILHYSLNLDGFLLLGSSENLGSEKSYYQTIHLKHKLFKNIETTKRMRTQTLQNSDRHLKSGEKVQNQIITSITQPRAERKLLESLSEYVLEHLEATTLFINEEYDIIEAKGNFGQFAILPKKGFSTNALNMLPFEFKIPITNSIREVKDTGEKVHFKNIVIQSGKDKRLVDLFAMAVDSKYANNGAHYMLTIVERDPAHLNTKVLDGATLEDSAKRRIENLERELELSKEKLLRSVEETETSNEELQATNEELLASNEELQSTNEELQSVNEELHTVNAEHIQKMEELALLNADMYNLLDS